MSDFSQHFQPLSGLTEAFIHQDEKDLIPSNTELPSSEEFEMAEDCQQHQPLSVVAYGPSESSLYKEELIPSITQSPNRIESTMSEICHHHELLSLESGRNDVFDYEEDDEEEDLSPSNTESPSREEPTVSEVHHQHHQPLFSASSQESTEAFIHQEEDITPSIIKLLHEMIDSEKWKKNDQDATESPDSADTADWPHQQLRHILHEFLHTWSRTCDGASSSVSASVSTIPSPPPDRSSEERASAQRLRLARQTLDTVNQVEHFLTLQRSNGNRGGRRKGGEKDNVASASQDFFLMWVKVLLNKLVWACHQTLLACQEE